MTGGASTGLYENFPLDDRGLPGSSTENTWRLPEVTYDYDSNNDAELPEGASIFG